MSCAAHEAEQHGWLTDLLANLEHIKDDPESSETEDAIDQALWCSLELERDFRDLVGAR